MITIAHTTRKPEAVDRLRAAFPEARLFQATLETLGRLVTEDPPDVVLVDEQIFVGRDEARLAILKAKHPWLVIVGLLPCDAQVLRRAFDLGRQRLVDDLLIAAVDDSAPQIRATIERARLRAVASTIEFACSPLPAVLARAQLEEALGFIAKFRQPRQFAAALGTSLYRLREELHACGLFPPKMLLGRFRLLVAAQMLQDSNQSMDKIGVTLYASSTAFRNAFRNELGATPGEVRQRGGLRFAGQLLAVSVQAWRLRTAKAYS